MGIIPHNFILLNQPDEFSEQRIRDMLSSEDAIVKLRDPNNIGKMAKNAIRENNVHMRGVK